MNLLPRDMYPNATAPSSLTSRRGITRDFMADNLAAIIKIVNTQFELIAHLESEAQKLKSDLIVKQEQVIELQEKLIADKDTQLKEFKETVNSLVGDRKFWPNRTGSGLFWPELDRITSQKKSTGFDRIGQLFTGFSNFNTQFTSHKHKYGSLRYELKGKARTRPDIIRLVLGPCAQCCLCEASEKNVKNQNLHLMRKSFERVIIRCVSKKQAI